MSAQAKTAQNHWQQHTPESIRHAKGELKNLAISQLLVRYNMGGQAWIQQFIFRLPLI